MPWWMNWYRSISRAPALIVGAAAILLLGVVTASRGQETLEERYQQALSAFNSAKMEEACEGFREVEKEKSGYKQTQTYLKVACAQVNLIEKREDDLFKEGVDLYSKGRLDDAKQKFDQASKVRLKNPKHATEISRYLKLIANQQSETRYFNEGVALFKEGRFSEAKARFDQVANAKGPKADDARNYLHRIEQAVQAAKQAPKPPPATSTPSSTPATQTAADDQILRTGLVAYFHGNLEEAERDLSNYLDNHGKKRDLAFFFRGAAHGTRYFLSGEKDAREKDLALADFRSARDFGKQFQPPRNYVSPKILTLYSEVAVPSSQ
jgi:tetratricopeptide (TPR) repeat protein